MACGLGARLEGGGALGHEEMCWCGKDERRCGHSALIYPTWGGGSQCSNLSYLGCGKVHLLVLHNGVVFSALNYLTMACGKDAQRLSGGCSGLYTFTQGEVKCSNLS